MIPASVLENNFINPKCLWPGDILLFRLKSPGYVQTQIENEQLKLFPPENAKWTHAAIYRDDYHIIEMTTNGAETKPLWEYFIDGKYEISIRRVNNISYDGGRTIVDAAYENHKLRSSYDFWAILKLKRLKNIGKAKHLTTPTIKASICSALCARAVAPLGVDLGQGMDHRLVTPAQLSYSTLLNDICFQFISSEEFLKWWKSRPGDLFNNEN